MASARQTTDHDEIREWVESRNGHPAEAEGTEVLRIDFDPENSSLEPIDWDQFFEIFEENNLTFLYDPEGHMVKFIQREGTSSDDDGHARASSRGGRKKSSSGRKKSTSGRKKSTSSRKKSTSGRKKSSDGRKKSSDGRKKSSSSRKKSTAKKSSGRKKSSARKSSAKKSTAKKSTAKKSSSRKKSTAKKSSAKKSSAKKSSSKKSTAKKSSGRKSSGGRKYGKKAQRKISRTMHEYGEGKLKSGRSGRSVKNRKQAIAIGISEARREGDKVPSRKGGRKKSGGRKRKKS